MHLNEAEVFITFILKDFSKEGNIVLLLNVSLDSIDDGGSPLDDKRLEAVLLIQVCIHVLSQIIGEGLWNTL